MSRLDALLATIAPAVAEPVAEPKKLPDAGDGDEGMISKVGAMRWAYVWESVLHSAEAQAALEALGYNLGFRPLEDERAVVEFKPARHKDWLGGLLPGDLAMVSSAGWAYNGLVLVKAEVRKLV